MDTLKDTAGAAAGVVVTFFVDETNLPAEFGPVLDLDGDGVLSTTDCSTTYHLLPTRLTVNYASDGRSATQNVFFVLGQKS
jgi:hypothetical protein